jgi:hypothetical protein
MKSLRIVLSVLLTTLSTAALAQSAATAVAPSAAQKSFDRLKALAGSWEGPVTVVPPQPEMSPDKPVHISLRIASRGNALVHEMEEAGQDDPTRYDHPVTMFYVDDDRLLLTHYCDAGNRPRMSGKMSPDGKTVEFEFIDLSGGNENGHMYHAVFTIIDANHHSEDWTYMMPGDKPVHAHMDLKRAQ